MTTLPIPIPQDAIADFCRRHRVARLELFGSVLRDDFGPGSDVDVLVEFSPGARVGLLDLAAMELDLTQILGRPVDLNTLGFLGPRIGAAVRREAMPIHVAA